jgi:hypothetical protein
MIYLNYFLVFLAFITVVESWILYRITRANGILSIFMAMIFGVAASVAVICGWYYNSLLRLVFWLLWIVGLGLLIKLLRGYYTGVSKEVSHDIKEVTVKLDSVVIVTPKAVIKVPGKEIKLPGNGKTD